MSDGGSKEIIYRTVRIPIIPQPSLWETARHGKDQPNGTLKKIWGWDAPSIPDVPYEHFVDESSFDWPEILIRYCPIGQVGFKIIVKGDKYIITKISIEFRNRWEWEVTLMEGE